MDKVAEERIRRIVDHAQSEIYGLDSRGLEEKNPSMVLAQGVIAKFALQLIENELDEDELEESDLNDEELLDDLIDFKAAFKAFDEWGIYEEGI
ncbi:MAG: hypothetical protein ACOC80_09155 [Petrotogales bacterium]